MHAGPQTCEETWNRMCLGFWTMQRPMERLLSREGGAAHLDGSPMHFSITTGSILAGVFRSAA